MSSFFLRDEFDQQGTGIDLILRLAMDGTYPAIAWRAQHDLDLHGAQDD
jgi:hypothetical protein